MPSINRSALVMHSVEEMFELINDVLSYPHFLPDCTDSKVLEAGSDSMTASLLVSKKGISKWFTTTNTFEDNSKVFMRLVDGPFKTLTGIWELTPLSPEACKVSLNLNYEFSSKVLEVAFGGIFNTLANNMVQSFTNRAKEVYGRNGS